MSSQTRKKAVFEEKAETHVFTIKKQDKNKLSIGLKKSGRKEQ